jgi:uncharacterized protein (TIGR02145 family)
MKYIQIVLLFVIISLIFSCKKDSGLDHLVNAKITTDYSLHVLTRSADVYGSVNISGVDSIYLGICWSTDSKPEVTDSVKFATWFSPNFHLKLKNLSPETKYYCRSFVGYNNQVHYGNVLEFQTCTDKVKDFDGNEYNVVDIGDQAWMAENLKTTHTSHGAPIGAMWYGSRNNIMPNREADMNSDGVLSSSDSLIYVNKYGLLYTWTTANNDVCPDGFHLPTQVEWTEICDSSGFRYNEIANELKSKNGWNNNKNGIDIYGFNVLPAGLWHDQNSTHYVTMGNEAHFWTSTEVNVNGADITIYDQFTRSIVGKDLVGFSVRCVKDGDP